jgi:tRNA(Ser,Leu) C12 N-acetylase TAN1
VSSLTAWWELVIPAAGVLAGAAVTGLIQVVNARSQREHERKARFLEERRVSYARFLLLFDDLIELSKKENELRANLAAQNEEATYLLGRAKALQDEIDNPSATKDPAVIAAENEEIAARKKANQSAASRDRVVLDECAAKLEEIGPKIGEIYYQLRLIAGEPVRQAASNMIAIGISRVIDNPGLISRAMKEFEEASRKDLL